MGKESPQRVPSRGNPARRYGRMQRNAIAARNFSLADRSVLHLSAERNGTVLGPPRGQFHFPADWENIRKAMTSRSAFTTSSCTGLGQRRGRRFVTTRFKKQHLVIEEVEKPPTREVSLPLSLTAPASDDPIDSVAPALNGPSPRRCRRITLLRRPTSPIRGSPTRRENAEDYPSHR